MAEDPRTIPVSVKAPHGAKVMEIQWADGHKAVLPHEILRGYRPCANCQGHGGTIHFVPGGDLEIRDIQQIGNYALQFSWGDRHDYRDLHLPLPALALSVRRLQAQLQPGRSP